MKSHRILTGSILACAIFVMLLSQPTYSGERSCLQEPVILLAQEEGDIDESYDLYGQDIDEEIEYDDAVLTLPHTSGKKPAPTPGDMPIDSLIHGITWYGHASFLIQNELNIYIDPYDLPEGVPPADLILVTHEHGDHFSPSDIEKVTKSGTILLSSQDVMKKLPENKLDSRAVKPGDTLTIGEVQIDVVHAYNVDKNYHQKKKQHMGFILHYEGRAIYHAGDTDLIPEMKNISADIALIPIGGKFTMDAAEAAKAANLMKPKVTIPMHWGKIIGSREDVDLFETKCNVPVIILEPEIKTVKDKQE